VKLPQTKPFLLCCGFWDSWKLRNKDYTKVLMAPNQVSGRNDIQKEQSIRGTPPLPTATRTLRRKGAKQSLSLFFLPLTSGDGVLN